MAQNSNNIINSWSFIAFARENGTKVSRGICKPATGSPYAALSFTKPDGKRTFVHFSSNLGELSKPELQTQKDTLQIVQLQVAPEVLARRAAENRQLESYILCRQGESSWENIDLGI